MKKYKATESTPLLDDSSVALQAMDDNEIEAVESGDSASVIQSYSQVPERFLLHSVVDLVHDCHKNAQKIYHKPTDFFGIILSLLSLAVAFSSIAIGIISAKPYVNPASEEADGNPVLKVLFTNATFWFNTILNTYFANLFIMYWVAKLSHPLHNAFFLSGPEKNLSFQRSLKHYFEQSITFIFKKLLPIGLGTGAAMTPFLGNAADQKETIPDDTGLLPPFMTGLLNQIHDPGGLVLKTAMTMLLYQSVVELWALASNSVVLAWKQRYVYPKNSRQRDYDALREIADDFKAAFIANIVSGLSSLDHFRRTKQHPQLVQKATRLLLTDAHNINDTLMLLVTLRKIKELDTKRELSDLKAKVDYKYALPTFFAITAMQGVLSYLLNTLHMRDFDFGKGLCFALQGIGMLSFYYLSYLMTVIHGSKKDSGLQKYLNMAFYWGLGSAILALCGYAIRNRITVAGMVNGLYHDHANNMTMMINDAATSAIMATMPPGVSMMTAHNSTMPADHHVHLAPDSIAAYLLGIALAFPFMFMVSFMAARARAETATHLIRNLYNREYLRFPRSFLRSTTLSILVVLLFAYSFFSSATAAKRNEDEFDILAKLFFPQTLVITAFFNGFSIEKVLTPIYQFRDSFVFFLMDAICARLTIPNLPNALSSIYSFGAKRKFVIEDNFESSVKSSVEKVDSTAFLYAFLEVYLAVSIASCKDAKHNDEVIDVVKKNLLQQMMHTTFDETNTHIKIFTDALGTELSLDQLEDILQIMTGKAANNISSHVTNVNDYTEFFEEVFKKVAHAHDTRARTNVGTLKVTGASMFNYRSSSTQKHYGFRHTSQDAVSDEIGRAHV